MSMPTCVSVRAGEEVGSKVRVHSACLMCAMIILIHVKLKVYVCKCGLCTAFCKGLKKKASADPGQRPV